MMRVNSNSVKDVIYAEDFVMWPMNMLFLKEELSFQFPEYMKCEFKNQIAVGYAMANIEDLS